MKENSIQFQILMKYTVTVHVAHVYTHYFDLRLEFTYFVWAGFKWLFI